VTKEIPSAEVHQIGLFMFFNAVFCKWNLGSKHDTGFYNYELGPRLDERLILNFNLEMIPHTYYSTH